MKQNNERYATYKDEHGEAYYCPMNAVTDDRIVAESEIDNCVEVSTVGRYAGNLNLAG